MTQPLKIPNMPQITHDNPGLGEALQKVETSANQGVTGNKVQPPHKAGLASVNPTKPPV